jgi:murein DD-endopeptidase MepM/ murein hydrolase activator NlpD
MAAGLVLLVIWALASGPPAPVAALSAPSPSSTTTTVDAATSTTGAPTTSLAEVPTTAGTDPTTTTTSADSAPAPGACGTSTTSTTTASGPTTTIPPTPAMAAEQASVSRSGPSSTAPLMAALAPLAKLGLSQEQMAILGFGQFPVAGAATYSDIFLEYRSWPEPHVHQGIDIDGRQGTPLRSPADGTLTYSDGDPNGYGLTALVTQSDGTVYLLAHMSATVLGLNSGTTVTQGQVIGFLGQTGDSTGPHLDFEIHPYGGAAIDAKPILDEYLAAAIAAAPALIARYEGGGANGAVTSVSVPSAAPENLYARPQLTDSGGGGSRPIAMVSTAGESPERILVAGALLTLVGVAWATWRSRRRSKAGWIQP